MADPKALTPWPCPPKRDSHRRCNVLVEYDLRVRGGTAELTLKKRCDRCGQWHETRITAVED